ncbi:DUF6934 family protein [Hymenobacter rubidus]|uniref:DUF6934 family protein n=1 Tax=Hymenobacter rubidus TaxID=1441626 RepID=UPI00191E7BEB|nr:hypothetical protein [Hymenobacter rubidus]
MDIRYDANASRGFTTFEFVSEGPNGSVTKVVRYTEINLKGFYNLGFGDEDPVTGYVSDTSVTNNNDSQKVLATVAATLYVFMDAHPGATVIATGSTEARTRLYRMGIANNLEAIERDYIVLGLAEENWQPFQKGVHYGAFLVRRKSLPL